MLGVSWKEEHNGMKATHANRVVVIRSKFSDGLGFNERGFLCPIHPMFPLSKVQIILTVCFPPSSQGTAANMRTPGKKGKKLHNREDEWQGRNLLSPQPTYIDDDDYEDHLKDAADLPLKPDDYYRPGSRRSSMKGKYSVGHSRDSHLESTLIDFDDLDNGTGVMIQRYQDVPRVFRSPPPMGHRGRSRSGVWDNQKLKSPVLPVDKKMTPEKRLFTMSAPDLLECLSDSSDSSSSGYGGSNYIYARIPGSRGDSLRGRPDLPIRPGVIPCPLQQGYGDPRRAFTLGNPYQTHIPQTHRTVHRSNSRGKIRC